MYKAIHDYYSRILDINNMIAVIYVIYRYVLIDTFFFFFRQFFLWQPLFTVQSHFSHCSFVVETLTEPFHAFQSWKHNARRTGQAEDVWWLEVTGLYYNFILLLKFPRQANHFTDKFSRTSCRSCVSRGSCIFGSSLGFSLSSTCTDPDGWCPSPSSSVFRFFFFLFAPFSSKPTNWGV